ncbi:2-hydroxyacyl-CoA dehydratase [Metallibacterium sp.]|uniref:2-hydroxyacyl-CoA dehydratase n=1 Tax=Metallibacterium sp. TaxID=2940281 RepID=UPI00260A65B0|nr:2-hydroxyacyl-CoA dehydratase [Metallibacterium sp.]
MRTAASKRNLRHLIAQPSSAQRAAVTPLEMKMARAKSEFLALRQRFSFSVADVIAFFPPEEGIEFLRQIIANSEVKARRVTKAQTSSSR